MASNAPPILPPGSRLAGYAIGPLVGRGGMGEVYRATQLSMQRDVALKVLAPKLALQDPAFAQQFVAEARAAGLLNHPNIIAVHDVGQAPAPEGCHGVEAGTQIHYFSMEFVDGESVKDLIERQGAVELPVICRIMTAMAEALSFAEAHKIVHRDIKPDNIMLAGESLVKLADLGLALQADSAEAVAGSKDDQGRGKVMGTPLYMAPEQARAQPLDHRADHYALGSTLYHMLTGRPPFQGESSRAIMRAHCFEPVPDPGEANPQVPPPWRDLCMRLMAKLPEERFPDAGALRQAVKAAVRWKPGAAPIRQRNENQQPSIAGLAVVTVLVLAALVWFLTRGSTPIPEPQPGPPPAKQAQLAQPGPDAAAVARTRVAQALAELPENPVEALAIVERLLADTVLAPAHGELRTHRDRLRQRLEDAKRNPLRAAMDQADADIAAERLQQARDRLADLPNKAWLAERRKALSERLAEAERTLDRRLSRAIDAARTAEACESLVATIQDSGLPLAFRQALDKRLEHRRQALTTSATADPAVWRRLGERIEAARAAWPLAAVAEACRAAAGTFPEADRKHVEALAAVSDLAHQAETALRLYIGKHRPRAECRFGNRSGTYLITRLDRDWVHFRLPDVPAESRAERASAVLPWIQFLGPALAAQGGADPRAELAFLWYWRQPQAEAARARLAQDPLATAIAVYERRTRPVDVEGVQARLADGLVSVAYPFAESPSPALLEAWKGAGASQGDRGMRWSTQALVVRGSMAEADLPGLRWGASLALPVTLDLTAIPEADTEVLLLGLTDGSTSVRVALNHRQRKAFLIATRADEAGTYEQLAARTSVDYIGLEPVRLRLTVDARGLVAITVNDLALTGERPLTFPAAARLAPVIQARPVTTGAGVQISTLSVSGKP